MTVKVSFELGNSASTSTVTVRLINRTTGDFTDAAFDQNGVVSTSVYNGAVSGNLYGFFRTVTLQDGDGATTESFSVSRVKLVNEDTLFPDTFTNTSGDNQWATSANWASGSVPTSYTDVTISSGQAIEAGVSTTAVANTIIVDSGGSLTIDQSSSLTVSGDFTNDGTVTLNSTADDYSSLIVEGTATGNVIYNRYVNSYSANAGGGWDGTGPPVAMSIADFITDNTGVIYQVGDTYALGPFNNLTNQYDYYTTTTGPNAGAFTAGKGYTMATTDTNGATVKYTGTIATTSQSIDVINNNAANGGVGRRWNFVSNPFPSYINGNATAEAVNNFMDVNSGVIDESFLGVYGWNGSSYTTYNNTSAAFSIAPGQGFFIAAASDSNTALNFSAAMRTTIGTGDFVSGPQALVYRLALKLYNADVEQAKTNFYFKNGLTLSLDPGYDAGAFNQTTKLSTRLPVGSQEFAFAINAMDINSLENARVPLEIRQNLHLLVR